MVKIADKEMTVMKEEVYITFCIIIIIIYYIIYIPRTGRHSSIQDGLRGRHKERAELESTPQSLYQVFCGEERVRRSRDAE